MANTLRFKRGLASGLPTGVAGEPLFTTDTFDLYIGTGAANQRYQKYIASGTTLQYLRGDGSLATFPTNIITGTGTTNYLPKFTGASALGNSVIFEGTRALGFNTATPVDFGSGTYNFHLHDAGIPVLQFTNTTTGQSSSVGMRLQANGNDLLFINSQATGTMRWNTNGAERMRLHATGNFHLGGTADLGQRLQVTGDGYFSGSVGIGTTVLTAYNLHIGKNITGSFPFAVWQDGTVQSTASNIINGFQNSLRTQAASFVISEYNHFSVEQYTLGAGSSVTSQKGFNVDNTMTGATNNYAFYGNIASGTGRWNLYMNGTAANFFNGSLGIGTTTLTGFSLRINKAITGSIESYGISQQGPVLNDVTTVAVGIDNALVLNAGAICSAYNHFRARVQFYSATSFGTQIGFLANNTLTQATNNYGFYGDIASGTGRWNLYMNGTADNFISGNTQIGTGAFTSEKLQVNGTMKVTGAATFSSSVTAGGNLLLTNGGAASIGAINLIRTGTSPVASRLTFGTDGTGYSFAIGKNQAGSVTDLVSILDSGAATFSSTITSTQTNGFTIGGLINVARIQYGSDAATSFSLLTAANAFAGLYASSAVFSSSVTATAMTLTTAGGQLKLKDSANEGFVGVSGTSMYFTDFATAAKGLIVNISTGAANFSSSIQAATAIAIGTTPDTNKPFKILKNINATVGINFENTSTSSLAFSAIQMGTDVTGGTKFTNLVYGSSGISQTGVYHPDGTSLINNGGGGLNFLGTPTRFYTGGSNGVVRLYLDNNGLTQLNATSPTTSETDGYRQYSADVVAGNAAPHFRTENGAVIKLYQETTAVGNSTISVGGGSAVLDDTQFGGYTLRQVVQALRNQGILA